MINLRNVDGNSNWGYYHYANDIQLILKQSEGMLQWPRAKQKWLKAVCH
jgi:hypothetical protein